MTEHVETAMRRNDALRDFARVVVVGTSCSGKSTLARRLSRVLDAPHIELDTINWTPGWQTRPLDESRQLVRNAAYADRWVMDGNYGFVRDIVWARATAVIWFNYPFRVVLWRALSRTTRRVLMREELFSGNRESFRRSFLSRESIILWAVSSHRRVRREYRQIIDDGTYPHLRIVELRGTAQADALLTSLCNPAVY